MPTIILASSSARRRQLLEEAGFAIKAMPADIHEIAYADELPDEFVCRMAREKAATVSSDHHQAVVVAADTIIALGDRIIGKPEDRTDATTILTTLSGREHHVLTGVCVQRQNPFFLHNWYVRATVRFRELTATEIDTYLDRANWQDKAGAYAIQEHGAELVETFSGLRSAIIGLPIEQVSERIHTALGQA